MQADGHISDSYIYGLNQLQIENTGKRRAYVHAQVFFFHYCTLFPKQYSTTTYRI